MSQPDRQEITYTDELLADRSVHRRYSDGRQEWRVRDPGGRVVRWRDDRGGSGHDEALGRGIVKRVHADGTVRYGREGGFGRTLWSDGVLTLNRTSYGGRFGTVLATAAAGVAIGGLVAPPALLSPEEEDELRREAEAQAAAGGSGGGEGGDDGAYGDFGGPDDGFDDDGDFG